MDAGGWSVSSWFIEGGPFVYVIVLLAMLSLPALLAAAGLVWAARGNRTLRPTAQIMAGATFLFIMLMPTAGLVGWQSGLNLTEQAVAHASPEYRDEMREAGRAYALYPLYVSGVFGGMAGFPAVVLLGVAFLPGRPSAATSQRPYSP